MGFGVGDILLVFAFFAGFAIGRVSKRVPDEHGNKGSGVFFILKIFAVIGFFLLLGVLAALQLL